MLKTVKTYFAKRSIQKLDRSFQSPQVVSLQGVKSIGVLMNFDDLQVFPAQQVRKELQSMLDVPLTFISFCGNKKALEEFGEQEGTLVLGKQDLGFDFSPSDSKPYDFDMLIDYRSVEDLSLQFVLLKTKCRLRMGFERPWNKSYLDFMIQVKEDVDFYKASQELVKYWGIVTAGRAQHPSS